jgi:hypothetical protein
MNKFPIIHPIIVAADDEIAACVFVATGDVRVWKDDSFNRLRKVSMGLQLSTS